MQEYQVPLDVTHNSGLKEVTRNTMLSRNGLIPKHRGLHGWWLPAHLWSFVIDTAIYIINCLIKEGFKRLPVAGSVPSLSHVKV
jgi:hypothetical protein